MSPKLDSDALYSEIWQNIEKMGKAAAVDAVETLKNMFEEESATKLAVGGDFPGTAEATIQVEPAKNLTPEGVDPSEAIAMILNTRQLSYSSLSQWDSCQHTWFGRYVLALPEIPTAAMLYGQVVHATLEFGNELYRSSGNPPDAETVSFYFAEQWANACAEIETPSGPLASMIDNYWLGTTFEEYLEAGLELIPKYFTEVAQDFVPLAVESFHTMDLKKMYPGLSLKYIDRFVGRIDMIAEGDVVIDFKTRKSAGNHKFMGLELQPTAYAALLGKPIKFTYIELIDAARGRQIKTFDSNRLKDDVEWFLSKYLPSKAKEIDLKLESFHENFPVADIEVIKQDPEALKRLVDASAHLFPPSPKYWCDTCSMRFLCGYREPLTLGY